MAEGWARTLCGDRIEPFSAGTEKHGLNPHAVAVMKEAGVDISHHRSKTVDEFSAVEFDVVVTVCSRADRTCPAFTGSPCIVHVAFDDPPMLAANARTDEEAIQQYRRVRDEIRDYVQSLPESATQYEN